MKIKNIEKTYIKNLYNNKISFNGIKKPEEKSMFIYDLDGTLANGNFEQINQILDISKKRNAKIIYATGRSLDEFYLLQNELLSNGINLKLPDFLIANNGGNIYINIDNKLYKDFEYLLRIKQSTNFDKAYVNQIINSINKNLEEIKSEAMTLKYKVPKQIDINQLRKNILLALSKEKITSLCGFKGENTDNQVLFIAPYNKSTAIQYLKNKLNIPQEEILMAGNDNNDISMAQLSKLGSKFICLNNSKPNLTKTCKKLSQENENIYFSLSNGAKGILEGLTHFLK